MSMPKSVLKMTKKDGVTFKSNVDQIKYTLHELSRAALKDVGKYITKEAKKNVKKRTGRGAKNIQYWVRYKQKHPNLQVGIKPGGFYMGFKELGTKHEPKIGALYNAVHDNIPTIIEIESKYLSALEDQAEALKMIDERESQE
jgi:HK97 gp10 family phage protein